MNGLFGWALGELGFDVTRATGAVVRAIKGELSEGNHLVLKVILDEGTYLADVGFGDGPRDPIQIVAGTFRSQGFDFGLERVDDEWWRLTNHAQGSAPNFDFNLESRRRVLARAKVRHAADITSVALRPEPGRAAPQALRHRDP